MKCRPGLQLITAILPRFRIPKPQHVQKEPMIWGLKNYGHYRVSIQPEETCNTADPEFCILEYAG